MDFNLSTPGLLFASISLLMLAYSTRFLAIAALIRELIRTHEANPNSKIPPQIANLRIRVRIIQLTQGLGIIGFFFCFLSMAFLFYDYKDYGKIAFAVSLTLLMISLLLSFIEISLSVKALIIQMNDVAGLNKQSLKQNPKLKS